MPEAPESRPRSLEDVYRAMVDPLYRYIYRQVGNREDAEDIAAEVFVRALRWLRLDADEHQIRAWLLRAARSAIKEFWRGAYRQPPLSDRDVERVAFIAFSDESEDAVAREAQAQAARLLSRLKGKRRTVLELRFLESLSVAETAERMGITTNYVKVLQHRALADAARIGLQPEPEETGEEASDDGAL